MQLPRLFRIFICYKAQEQKYTFHNLTIRSKRIHLTIETSATSRVNKNICQFFEVAGSHASHRLRNANVTISPFSVSKCSTELMQPVRECPVE